MEEIIIEKTEKESKWYVLRVVSGKERKVKEYLDKDIIRNGWDKLIKQVFLPVEKVYKVVNGKKVMRERNFYPGYIMIEVAHNKLSDDIIQHVSNISNVMHFLTDGKGSKGKIICLRKAEVNKISPYGVFVELSDSKIDCKLSIDEKINKMISSQKITIGSMLDVKIKHISSNRVVIEMAN